jgi:hypothetical protein
VLRTSCCLVVEQMNSITSERLTFVIQLMALFSAVITVIAVCGTIIVYSAFQKTEKDAARSLSLMVNQTGGLQLLTVIVIGISVLILRVFELISADAAVSALTGMAGFVLGGFTGTQSKREKVEENLREPP